MKKTILAAALCVAIPSFALADATVYGSIRAGISNIETKKTSHNSSFGVDDFGSRIGFKGNENLGNGLKAIWQVETGFGIDGTTGNSSTDTGVFANRESFVGAQASFGKLRVGHISDVLSDTQATDKQTTPRRERDFAVTPLYEGTDLLGPDMGDSRFKNSIRFDSAEYAGFSGSLQYGAGEDQAAGQMKQRETWASRLSYKNSGFFGAWAFAKRFNTAGEDNSSINRFEAGYNANGIYVAATYQRSDIHKDAYAMKDGADGKKERAFKGAESLGIKNTGNNHLENDAWALAASYTFGKFTPWVEFSKRNNAKVDGVRLNDAGAKQWAMAVDYKASKRTTLRAGYGEIRQGEGARKALGWLDNKSTSTWAMVRHDF